MSNLINIVLEQGTVIDDMRTKTHNNCYVRVMTYILFETVYYIVKVNNEIVEFVDTSKSRGI